MQFKNPLLFSIILFATMLISVFYIYIFLIQPAGAIYLTYETPDPYDSTNFYIVTVAAEDLKVPFFGTAFHINYNPEVYKYDHFSLGDYFEPQDDPIVLVNESTQNPVESNAKIIIGLSLKRGQIIKKSEGTLLKLYFKNSNSIMDQTTGSDFHFSNAVFSTFDKKRKDIKNITFYP
jgi:hypothetical protein